MKIKNILVVFLTLFLSPIFAETVGHVQYHLPCAAAENWVCRKTENKRGVTLIYTPQQSENSKEFFAVNSNSLPANLEDVDSVKAVFSYMYPDREIHLSVMEKRENSLLFEWSASEGSEEKIHGWGRIFSTPEGTVTLGYQTDKISTLAQARVLWLPTLEEACLENH